MGGAGRTLALRTSLFLTPRIKVSEPNEDATCLWSRNGSPRTKGYKSFWMSG
jgi:hypothetical protein